MKKISVILMIISVISSVLGFGRELVLGHYFGASSIVDAYQVSISITMTFFLIFGTGLITTFIPTYTRIENKYNKNKAIIFTNQVIFSLLVLSIFIFSVIYIFDDFLINTFASGFDDKTTELTKKFLMISAFGIFFNNLFYIFKAFLQAKKSFILASLVGIPFNLIVILSIIISYKTDEYYYLAIGNLFALFVQALTLYPSVKKRGISFNIVDQDTKPEVITMLKSSIPVIIGVSINELNNIISKTLASNTIGGIASLNYANRLTTFVQTIFVTTLVTLMYPHISKLISLNKSNEFKDVISKTLRVILLIILPISLLTMLLSNEIIKLLFGNGNFTDSALKITSNSLFFYGIGMVAIGYREVISRVFYSLNDTKTPMKNAAYGILINICISLIFYNVFKLGVPGLALATSISAIIISMLLSNSLRKQVGFSYLSNDLINIIKILISSLFMITIVYFVKIYLYYINIKFYFIIIFCSICGLILYLILIYFLKIHNIKDEYKRIINKIKNVILK